MLSRAKQCNVLWSHVEQQRLAAGDPSSSSCPHAGAAAPARAGVLTARYKSDKCKPLYAHFKGRYFLSLEPAFFFFFGHSEPAADRGRCSLGG